MHSRSLALAIPLFIASGCGGWSVSSAQRALTLGAEFAQQSDEQIAPVVASAVERCDEENETREDFLSCLEPYMPLRTGVSLTRRSLRLGQSVVDAWRAGQSDESDWLPVAACIVQGLRQVAAAIEELDLDLPTIAESILQWTQSFGAMVEGVCSIGVEG